MKKVFRLGLGLIVSALITVAAAGCGGQAKQKAEGKMDENPFKGMWYSDVVELEIDFYENTVAIDGPDEEYGPGNIRYGMDYCFSTDFSSVEVTGNKATATMGDGDNVTFEATDDGNLVMTSSGITYVDMNESQRILPSTIVLKRAKPEAQTGAFRGTWRMKEDKSESGLMEIDLYDKTFVGQDADLNDAPCYGLVNRVVNMRPDDCTITGCEVISETEATIEFVGSRGGSTFRAKLVYDPEANTLTVKDRETVKTEGMGECYLYDGLVFYKE